MAAGLGESPLRLQAVVIAHAPTAAAARVTASGWLVDPLGTRRVFFRRSCFTLGSLAYALSRDPSQIVLARRDEHARADDLEKAIRPAAATACCRW